MGRPTIDFPRSSPLFEDFVIDRSKVYVLPNGVICGRDPQGAGGCSCDVASCVESFEPLVPLDPSGSGT